jgi:acetyltransferase-like isoleucine patch superfamily enzyme
MEMGKYSYGRPNIRWSNKDAKLIIGKYCSIASNVNIYLGGNHNINHITTYPFGHIYNDIFKINNTKHPSTRGDVIIGNDVWIADNVTIMSGVTINDGAVICNNSHVIKDVLPYSITGGNPAKHIKYRFTDEQIQKLLLIKWWDFPEEKLNKYLNLLCSENIDDFINLF